ncbi:HEXXH motif domain-containing protein [Amycolatopsis sp. DG1A-15b]|uniref:HEXXH motif domain-containing protein n=1 Tax=Amycolatopsis sp. DG1A-15b TaxID=3052846 RepID=UPI00255BCF8C|nr:HEXXH motif domain-containing protein [Amycolatopsis sp. DG1A-15b]WIX88183.1 HEXXH motif domain-containing protein [Amycolatopsis sp. DG1A-15b]
MRAVPFTLRRAQFAALARGGGGPSVVRLLADARLSRTLHLIRHLAGTQNSAASALAVLARLEKARPGSVVRVLRHPSVGAWALRVATRGETAVPGLQRIILAAAVHARVPVTADVPGRDVAIPGMGTVLLAEPGRITVTPIPGGTRIGPVTIPLDWRLPADHWYPLPRVTVGARDRPVTFLLDDWSGADEPPAMVPDTAAVPDVWEKALGAAWQVLSRHHPGTADELPWAIKVVTPLRGGKSSPVSGTADAAFGCVFLSPPADPVTAAASLTHELQHTKLIGLTDLFPLISPGADRRYYAPWRTDPRPASGLLHGSYAFAGVAAFWRKQRRVPAPPADRLFAETEFARWRKAVAEALAELRAGDELTDLGREFTDLLAETVTGWLAEPVGRTAAAAAGRLDSDHRAAWLAVHRTA